MCFNRFVYSALDCGSGHYQGNKLIPFLLLLYWPILSIVQNSISLFLLQLGFIFVLSKLQNKLLDGSQPLVFTKVCDPSLFISATAGNRIICFLLCYIWQTELPLTIQVINKDTKQSRPLYQSLRSATMPAGLCTANQYTLEPSKPANFPLTLQATNKAHISPILLKGDKETKRSCCKDLAKAKICRFHCSCFVHWGRLLIREQ